MLPNAAINATPYRTVIIKTTNLHVSDTAKKNKVIREKVLVTNRKHLQDKTTPSEQRRKQVVAVATYRAD